jgi:hypothetical protein
MVAWMLQQFAGEVPRTGPTELGANYAQTAVNAKLYPLELQPYYGPKLIYKPNMQSVRSMYLLYPPSSIDAVPIWLTWQTDVDVILTTLTDTTDGRFYFTEDGVYKKSDYTMASTGSGPYPAASAPGSVPAPTSPPNAAVQGAANPNDTLEDRAYVYTYLNQFGSIIEESAPSPASAIVTTDPTAQTVLINDFQAPPSGYNIVSINIYRSIVGASGAVNYVFVGNILISSAAFNDGVPDADVGEVLPSLGWNVAPAGLTGLVTHPAGFAAGFVGNTVYFTPPFLLHTWPDAYALSYPTPIVGLAVWGTSIVVVTKGQPYLISGTIPGSLTSQLVPIPEPGVSKRSICVSEYGAVYASPNGLVEIGYQLQDVMTTDLFRRTDWQKYDPATMVSVIYDQKYWGFFQSSSESLQGMVIDKGDTPELSFVNLDTQCAFVDERTAGLYYFDDAAETIYLWDQDTVHPLPYQWMSKRMVYPHAVSFSVLKVDADFSEIESVELLQAARASDIAYNQTLSPPYKGCWNSVPWNTFDWDGSTQKNLPEIPNQLSLSVVINGDNGSLIAAYNVQSFDPIRMPALKNREFTVSVLGNLNVRSVMLATTIQELYSGVVSPYKQVSGSQTM